MQPASLTSAPSPKLFFSTVNAFQRTEALRVAIEINLFGPLASGPLTAADLASACNASERGVRILANFLTTVGFLNKVDNRYETTADSSMFLNPASPAYLGESLRFMLTPSIRDCYSQLTEAVRRGGTAISEDGTVSYDNPVWVDFARGMGGLMQLPSKLLVELISHDSQRPLQVLDVAAGHGLFGIAFVKCHPLATVAALDWPNVLAVAQENAQKANVLDRYRLIPGSAFEVDWGGPYDLVLLTNFLHHFDLATCEQIARRAFNALAPGGRVLTLEFIPDSDRINPPGTAEFALTMLATTARGDAYTFADYEKLFSAAGFTRSEFHPLPPTTQQAVVSYK